MLGVVAMVLVAVAVVVVVVYLISTAMKSMFSEGPARVGTDYRFYGYGTVGTVGTVRWVRWVHAPALTVLCPPYPPYRTTLPIMPYPRTVPFHRALLLKLHKL